MFQMSCQLANILMPCSFSLAATSSIASLLVSMAETSAGSSVPRTSRAMSRLYMMQPGLACQLRARSTPDSSVPTDFT